jgi:hypothetical protein
MPAALTNAQYRFLKRASVLAGSRTDRWVTPETASEGKWILPAADNGPSRIYEEGPFWKLVEDMKSSGDITGDFTSHGQFQVTEQGIRRAKEQKTGE